MSEEWRPKNLWEVLEQAELAWQQAQQERKEAQQRALGKAMADE